IKDADAARSAFFGIGANLREDLGEKRMAGSFLSATGVVCVQCIMSDVLAGEGKINRAQGCGENEAITGN
ncbi:MAG: hypothetical protein AAFQ90_11835, partial [Pseudomonadota bacterium]